MVLYYSSTSTNFPTPQTHAVATSTAPSTFQDEETLCDESELEERSIS